MNQTENVDIRSQLGLVDRWRWASAAMWASALLGFIGVEFGDHFVESLHISPLWFLVPLFAAVGLHYLSSESFNGLRARHLMTRALLKRDFPNVAFDPTLKLPRKAFAASLLDCVEHHGYASSGLMQLGNAVVAEVRLTHVPGKHPEPLARVFFLALNGLPQLEGAVAWVPEVPPPPQRPLLFRRLIEPIKFQAADDHVPKVKTVEIDAPEFTPGHRVLGSGRKLAQTMLTPAARQRLLALAETHPGHFGVSFVEDRAYAVLIVPPSEVDANWLLPANAPERWEEVESDVATMIWLLKTVAPELAAIRG